MTCAWNWAAVDWSLADAINAGLEKRMAAEHAQKGAEVLAQLVEESEEVQLYVDEIA